MDDNQKIFCSVCGAEMLISSRYCMKCGALNYDHPSNSSMKKYIKKKRKEKKESLIKINADNKLDKKGITRSEKVYKMKKFIMTLFILIVIGLLIYVLWPYLEKFISFFIDLLKNSWEYFK